jgi:TolB-like protein/AraC-like DNA-binding protein
MHREFIQKLTNLVEANLHNEKFGVSQLAREIGMSRFNLNRKLKSINNQTISQFVRETRLKKAKEFLQNEELTVAEIAYRVGFGSATYFSKCFHEYFGYSPGELRDHEQEEEPVETVVVVPQKRNRMKILIALIICLFLVIPTGIFIYIKLTRPIQKSIAVLPFINDSQDSTNVSFINGVTESITDKLTQINDLKVTSRNSAEQYRNNNTKSTPHIGRELRVRYILEGSCQKIGDSVLVSVQLIDALKDRHILSQQYFAKYGDIFNLFSEIALDVASKVQAKITPEEKKLIEKTPSENIELIRMLIQAKEFLSDINIDYRMSQEQLKYAEIFYRKAIAIDSTYSEAWRNLGVIYSMIGKPDSALILLEKSLEFDSKNSETYLQQGIIYCGLHNAAEMV